MDPGTDDALALIIALNSIDIDLSTGGSTKSRAVDIYDLFNKGKRYSHPNPTGLDPPINMHAITCRELYYYTYNIS